MQLQKFPQGVPLTEEQITRSLEAYLLWLFSKVMFTENHVNTINKGYIPIAYEIATAQGPHQIVQRSWGSAVLAATYRGMCRGSCLYSPNSALLGCPLFLQLWAWERFQPPFQTSQHTTFRPSQQTPFQTPPPRPTQE